MTKIWEQCVSYKDKWAGIPISFTACVSIDASDGKYRFCIKFSNYYEKCFDLVQTCYDDSFGIEIVEFKFRACIQNLAISTSEISGNISLEAKLCASIAGCTRWKSFASIPFRVVFFAQPADFIKAGSYIDLTDYDPDVQLVWHRVNDIE